MAALSTILAGAAVGGMLFNTARSNAQAGKNAPTPPIVTPPPVYVPPNMTDVVRRSQAKITGASGRASTIKTGPSGITSAPPVTAKTLLGE